MNIKVAAFTVSEKSNKGKVIAFYDSVLRCTHDYKDFIDETYNSHNIILRQQDSIIVVYKEDLT